MSGMGIPRTGSRRTTDLEPFLSPESQKDLEDALDETPSAEDVKRAWVEENIRDLHKAFAAGRKANPAPCDGSVEIYSAVEGTERDLRYILGTIYDKYGRLAMYDKGIDSQARHLVVGYQSIRGRQTVQKVMLHVSQTQWTRASLRLGNAGLVGKAEDRASLDPDDWTVVENFVG